MALPKKQVTSGMGRKAAALAIMGTGPFMVATIALFTGKMSAAEWSSFIQILFPMLYGAYVGANVIQKGVSR